MYESYVDICKREDTATLSNSKNWYAQAGTGYKSGWGVFQDVPTKNGPETRLVFSGRKQLCQGLVTLLQGDKDEG